MKKKRVIIALLVVGIAVSLCFMRDSKKIKDILALPTDYRTGVITSIIRDVTGVLSSANIDYWAHFGTLLGSVREKGVIPHDYDVDLSILQSDASRAVAKLKKNLVGYKIGRFKRFGFDNITIEHPSGIGCDIALFTRKGEYIVRTIPNIVQPKNEKKGFLYTDIYPTQEVDLSLFTIRIPRKPDPVLRTLYGDSYMTPRKRNTNGWRPIDLMWTGLCLCLVMINTVT